MKKILAVAFGLMMAVPLQAATAATLDDVKKRGKLMCGVSQGLPGFSSPDDAGEWHGIDVDLCRAIAAAIFDDPMKAGFVPTSSKERFTALQSGEFDVLTRNTTYSLTRDTTQGLNFVAINFYDGQGFMVRKDLGVASVKELDGAVICANAGTTTELNVADFFRANGLEYQIVTFEKADEVVAAYDAGRCDSWTTDVSGLYSNRLKLANPDDHVILPDVISREPLGPAVRQGDDGWGDLVRWVFNAMIVAEEFGVTQANVEMKAKTAAHPELKRLLGLEGNYGEKLGLSKDWAIRVIKHVGNYAESYDRTVGKDSPLKIKRGQNALERDGGLMYPLPVR